MGAHDFLRRPLENRPDLRLEAALVANRALPEALLLASDGPRTTILAICDSLLVNRRPWSSLQRRYRFSS
jgi:hypothetical protein